MTAPQLTFVPTTTTSMTPTVDLNDIPDDIKAQVEEVYEALKSNKGRMHVAFDTAAEKDAYVKLATSYCAQRPAGPIHFRKSPVRKQAENELDFRITDKPTENANDNKGINDAVDAVKTAAKTVAKK